jgi:hypothetical protein
MDSRFGHSADSVRNNNGIGSAAVWRLDTALPARTESTQRQRRRCGRLPLQE